MITGNSSESRERARQARSIERALQKAVRQTLIDHKRAGDPVVFCSEDGLAYWVSAEEIEIPEIPDLE